MEAVHLSTSDLLSVQKGEALAPKAMEHLATCPTCQRRLDESLWTQVLGRSDESLDAGVHLDPEEIQAYRQSALPTKRIEQIERHLRGCSSCLAVYQRGRALERSTGSPMAPARLLRKVRNSFRRGRTRWVGTVLVTGLDRGPTAILLPGRRVASGPSLLANPPDEPQRLEDSWDRVPDWPGDLPVMELESADGRESFSVTMDSLPDARVDPEPEPEPLRIRSEPWEIRILPMGDPSHHVRLQIVSARDSSPASGVRVAMKSDDGKQYRARTDASGRVRLPLPRRSRVLIRLEPPFGMRLLFAD